MSAPNSNLNPQPVAPEAGAAPKGRRRWLPGLPNSVLGRVLALLVGVVVNALSPAQACAHSSQDEFRMPCIPCRNVR